jgi:hypothetical protein
MVVHLGVATGSLDPKWSLLTVKRVREVDVLANRKLVLNLHASGLRFSNAMRWQSKKR